MKSAVLGLGAMGAPMALNLQRAGLLTACWNRSPERMRGLPGVETPAEAARQCELLLISVARDEDVLEVVEALLPGAHPRLVVADTSTVSGSTCARAAKLLAPSGAHFLDCPVSGGVEGARAGSLVMLVGGDPEKLAQVQPTLKMIAAKIFHMGPTGAGQATKAVNQLMAAGVNQAVTEALAFGDLLGLDLERLVQALSCGAAASWFLEHRGKSMIRKEFQPGFKLALHHKDLQICRTMANTAGGGALPILEMTLAHYRELIEEGAGDLDISALYRLKRKRLGEKPP